MAYAHHVVSSERVRFKTHYCGAGDLGVAAHNREEILVAVADVEADVLAVAGDGVVPMDRAPVGGGVEAPPFTLSNCPTFMWLGL